MNSMRFNVKFSERNSQFSAKFGEIQEVSDGGYERGYEAGYEVGKDEVYEQLLGGEW